MPVTTGEQRGFLVCGIGMLLIMTLVAWLSSNQKDQGVGSPSSYKVQRWKQPPAQLPADAASGVTLVLAGPETYAHAEEKSGIIRFLLRGGRVLIAGVRPDSFVPQASSEDGDLRVGFAECTPVAPTQLTRGGPISQDD